MKMLYGNFSNEQMSYAKSSLSKSIMWLLIYADPATNAEYGDGILQPYFKFLLKKIGGLNTVLGCPKELVEILSILQAAYMECSEKDFVFNHDYRKLILDAHALVKKIKED